MLVSLAVPDILDGARLIFIPFDDGGRLDALEDGGWLKRQAY
jgi:hypothetical protein